MFRAPKKSGCDPKAATRLMRTRWSDGPGRLSLGTPTRMWLTEKFRLTASNFSPIAEGAVAVAVAAHHQWVEAAAVDLPDLVRRIPQVERAPHPAQMAPEDWTAAREAQAAP